MRRVRFVYLLVPVFFAACSQNNVKEDSSLQRYFDSAGVKGTFGMFDNGQGRFTIYNLPRFRDSAYQPESTFDIFQSLVAIQTGVVKDDSAIIFTRDTEMVVKVDTTNPNGQDAFHQDKMSLRESFRSPGLGQLGFSELAARIGRDTLKKWIDSVHYGNRDLGDKGTEFWFNGHLKITADEQLGLIKQLYFNQLPFFEHTQKLVVNMMPMEANSNYKLAYKTGWGFKASDRHPIGWVMGWVEENKNLYFFVLNLESEDPKADVQTKGFQIVKGILRQLGFFEGKK